MEIFAADRDRSILRIPLERAPPPDRSAFRGSNTPPCGARCRIASKWRSPSARPIAFLRERQRFGAGRRPRRDSRPPAGRRFPFSGDHRNRRRICRSTIARAHAAFLRLLAAGGIRARRRHGSGQRSGSLRRARSARHDFRIAGGRYFAPGVRSERTPGCRCDAPMIVHFGDSDFAAKYQTLIEDIGQWRATAGRVESVDLRFSREAVVNPDRTR